MCCPYPIHLNIHIQIICGGENIDLESERVNVDAGAINGGEENERRVINEGGVWESFFWTFSFFQKEVLKICLENF